MEMLWRFLENRPNRTAVMAEWRAAAGEHLAAVSPLLQPTGRLATVYPHPRGGRPLRVVRHADGSIVAILEDDWQTRIPLGTNDVSLHRFDLRAARKGLCAALDGVNIVRSPADDDGGCIQVGNWEPKKAASFPAYLLLCRDRPSLRRRVVDLQRSCDRPGALLLTPTRSNWSDDLETLARGGKMLLAAICEITAPAGSALRATVAWEEYLQAFCQMVRLTLPGNFRNKRPSPMRGARTAKIEKLEKAMEAHLLAARDHAHSLNDRGREPSLLPRPEQKDLAKATSLTTSDVCRCLSDPRAKLLNILWETAESLDAVMNFNRRR